jgi:hypothetical protein
MKAITVKREYADRIANGTKHFEVRNFRPEYRGDIVVTVSREKIAICVVELCAIAPSAPFTEISDEEKAFGKWAWQLCNPRWIKPMPVRGQLGLWQWNYPEPEYCRHKDSYSAK